MLNGRGPLPPSNCSSKSKSRPRSNLGMSLKLAEREAAGRLWRRAVGNGVTGRSVKASLLRPPKGSGSGKSMGGSKSKILGGLEESGGVGMEEKGRLNGKGIRMKHFMLLDQD